VIVYEAVSRIVLHRHLALPPSLWPFAVLLVSIVVDFSRSRTLGRIARQHRSDALAADSLHFATDMWATLAVMLGLGATYAGERLALPWLEFADPIAALVVAGVILRVSWRLAHQTIDALLDATPTTDPTSDERPSKDQLRANLLHDLTAIPGVLSVERLRTRRSGSNYFADVTLGLPRNLTFQRSEQLTLAATQAVQRHLPGADVVVHTVPIASLAESVHDRIRAVAARRNLAIHEISVQQISGEQHDPLHPQLHIEQHLEVDETMPLRQAHEMVTDLEAEMRHEVPSIASILTHIESEPATIERPASLERDRELELRLRRVAAAFPEVLDIHEVYVTRHGPSVVPAAPHSASGDPSATGPQSATNDWQPSTAFPELPRSPATAPCPTIFPWPASTPSSPRWKAPSNSSRPRSTACSSTPSPPPTTAASKAHKKVCPRPNSLDAGHINPNSLRQPSAVAPGQFSYCSIPASVDAYCASSASLRSSYMRWIDSTAAGIPQPIQRVKSSTPGPHRSCVAPES